MFRHAAVLTAVPLLLAGLHAAPAGADSETRRSMPVAPGVTLTTSESTGGDGPLRLSSLAVDLDGGARVGYVDAGEVAAAAPVSEYATSTGAVAAVNGDFFDAGDSLAPLGGAVQDGEVLKSPTANRGNAVTIDSDAVGRVQELLFEGTADLPDGPLRVDRLNSHEIPRDGVGVFTARWGGHPRADAVAGADRATEVVLADGVVREVRSRPGGAPVAADETVLLGREAAADRLAGLAVGDRVTVRHSLTADGAEGRRPFPPLHTAIGGRNVLIRDGRILDVDDSARQPRTAIGFSADGGEMTILVADGRHAGSRGATLREMAERLRAAGAADALELDGGGSSTLLARRPGEHEPLTWNRTGEAERAVPNGLAVYAPEGDGQPHGLWVRPRQDPRPAPGPGSGAYGDPHRVFSGLTRELVATAHDDGFGPVRGEAQGPDVRWSASAGTVADGRYTAPATDRPASARVTATAGSAAGAIDLEVLPPPESIAASVSGIAFRETSGTAAFTLLGTATGGARVPIEPGDATVRTDTGLVEVTAREDGTFRVRPAGGTGAGEIDIAVGDLRTSVPVGVGSARRVVTTFDDAARWTAEAAQATADVAPASGRDGTALALSYDFTGSRGTRAAYAVPPEPLAIGGHTHELRLHVRGDGNGGQIAARVVDATGQRRAVYGPRVDWQGWRRADLPIPEGLAQPVSVERLYLVETRVSGGYSGQVVFDRLAAVVTPVG
ncbi:phosphodiester glycosidase family protein [Marinactinospora rubrisoli]|uniref:Phosphodiester glycosidase family protein n=1 Tax=Marinactinospora rubrisoli TaxID=2715399 RepID=A0ABW2KLE6_9ACTN